MNADERRCEMTLRGAHLEAVCKPLVAFARLQTRRPALGKATHISSIWAALPALSAPLSLTLGAHPEFTDSF